MSNFYDNAVQITKKLKDNYDFPILWGGIHPTVRPEESLQHADMVCIGESEETLVDLANRMQNKQNYYDLKGMGFNDNGKIIVNGHRELPGSAKAKIKSLDELPFQDYDIKSHFVLDGENIVQMNMDLFKKHWDLVYMTQTTRGCPFACTFCINNHLVKMHPHQKPIRKRSVDNLIGELQEATARLPLIRHIMFDDDAFFLRSVSDIEDFSKKYKEHIGKPLIITGATPSTLTKEKLSLLVDAGLVEMRMGIQTAAESSKKLYKRPHTNQQVENAVRMVNEFKGKVRAKYDIILDSPWDSDQDSIETLMFLSKLPTPFWIGLFSLVYYPGTEVYNRAKKDGLIKDDLNDVYRKTFQAAKKTYYNRLFFLLRDYADIDIGISTKFMHFLIHNKIARVLHVTGLLISILKMLYPFYKLRYLIRLKGFRKTLHRLKTTQIPKIARLFKKLKKEPVLFPR